MTSDRTEQQSSGQIKSARDLSLKPKSPPALVPGYKIESLLGSGAYGEVWLALDEKTGRRVAIKFYTRQTSLDFSLLSREVEKLVFLSADRYVVQLLDVGWDAKPPYYVMDYIDNGSLEDELKRRDTMPVEEAVDLIEEVCIGLMHLHGKGILHCDLKPGNVLLDQDKKPRLADFGQSRLSHEQAPALGTLFFMAPEQADLKAAPDARWDVYALGALLYCMLTGEPPFRDSAMLKKIESSEAMEDRLLHYRKLIDEAPQPTAHRKAAGVDRSLADIIDGCIERNPKKRFASVQSVFEALRQREHSQARRPLMILGLLGPLLLLAVMSLFGYNAYHRAISQTDEAIKKQTVESSRWVAKLAARSAAEQIDNYFRVVNELANDSSFQKQLARVLEDERVQELVAEVNHPGKNDTGDPQENQRLDQLRQTLKNLPLRIELDDRLRDNLNDPSYPNAASWFVCDTAGTQIASVFETDETGKARIETLGKNYSYRSYFTGHPRNAERKSRDGTIYEVSDDPAKRDCISRPHLSAIFRSKATDTWKIAFSVPIYHEGKHLGIVAVTENILGSFVDFEDTPGQYAMLVDGREGQYKGTVLEHPLINKILEAESESPTLDPDKLRDFFSKMVDEDVLAAFAKNDYRLAKFRDPMSTESLGAAYDKPWLASWANVQQRSKEGRVDTGLKVIAVADQQSALQPSRRLGRLLAGLGTLAIVFFLLVTIGLLYFVFRSLRKSRERVARVLGLSENTSTGIASANGGEIHDLATILEERS